MQEFSSLKLCTAVIRTPPAKPEEFAPYAVTADRVPGVLAELLSRPQIREAFLLSTCQRTEVTVLMDPCCDLLQTMDTIPAFAGCTQHSAWRTFSGLDAVHHALRVTTGLDSNVVAENEIVSQVRQAYETATKVGGAKRHLHYVMRFALESAKYIRREHGLETRVAPLGQRVCETLRSQQLATLLPETLSVLVIGAGEIGASVLAALVRDEHVSLTLCNRTFERARELVARHGGQAVPFEQLEQAAVRADVIIAAVHNDGELLSAASLAAAGRLRLVIDVGVNPVCSPAVLRSAGVSYLTRKQLDGQTAPSERERAALLDAERAINHHVVQFQRDMMEAHAKAMLSTRRPALREAIHGVLRDELKSPVSTEEADALEKKLFFLFSRQIAGVLNMETIPAGPSESALATRS